MAIFAFKRLVAVEVDLNASNQHEFNAGGLRKELHFPEGRTDGPLSLLFYLTDAETPVLQEGDFTLYDARERHPTRSEYRLYYRIPAFGDLARAGDLLVLFRDAESGGLQGVVARPGTAMERQMEEALQAGDHSAVRKFLFRDAAKSQSRDAVEMVQTLLPLSLPIDLAMATQEHPLHAAAIEKAEVPPGKQMALAGREIAEVVWGRGLGPDDFLTRGLEAESDLYFSIEREVGKLSLQEVMGRGNADLEAILSWAMRRLQSRKSRRGQSLQHHFAFLLDREGIPFTPQCETERGETPDFVVPGRSQYLDSGYPSERLRMVACKSTVRERWGQILKEAERVSEKYLLTVDSNLTPDTVRSMHEVQLTTFAPRSLIENAYSSSEVHDLLSTVGQLIANLRAVL